MAKKTSRPVRRSARKKKPVRRKIEARPPEFESRWMELAGVKPSAGLPAKLISSIVTLGAGQAAGGAGANPEIVVFARRVQGEDCEKMAEIAGWYSMNLKPNGQCIGQAKVKAALDAAAQQECCNTLECPEKCPCFYNPQPQLAAYRCVPGVVEEGFLLQGTEVWNCRCLAQ